MGVVEAKRCENCGMIIPQTAGLAYCEDIDGCFGNLKARIKHLEDAVAFACATPQAKEFVVLRMENERLKQGIRDCPIETYKVENAALRETVSSLNRRCQQAESAARETVEAVQAKGMSLGRGLANWAATDTARRNAKLREKLIWIRANHDSNGVDCPICMAVDEALNA